jgi:hypothetical protein
MGVFFFAITPIILLKSCELISFYFQNSSFIFFINRVLNSIWLLLPHGDKRKIGSKIKGISRK